MAISPKTIYLEVDEEITSVIDKLRKTEYSDVVLMIPKGASLTQSVVNLKLIKRKADELSKNISIVTGDKVARALADKVGIAAASSAAGLGVVEVPKESSVVNTEGEATTLIETNEVIGDKPSVSAHTDSHFEEPEDLVVTEGEDEDEPMEKEGFERHSLGESTATAAASGNLMPKLPWKKILIFGGIPLFALLLISYIYLPRAKATVYVRSESKQVSINISGDKNTTLDTEKAVVPTQIVEVNKDTSKKFGATGKKDVGTKAAGTVRVTSTEDVGWMTGTRMYLSSNSGLIYTTDAAVNIIGGGSIVVGVTAQNAGEKYNIPMNSHFLVLNDPNNPALNLVAQTAISGGTTKQVTVVTQGDINSAKDSLVKEATTDTEAEFTSKASELKVIDDSKKTEVVSAVASPKVDEEAVDFTLTVKIRVRAVAVSSSDLSEIVKAEVNRQLGATLQIIDDGSQTLKLGVDASDLETGKIAGTLTTTAFVANKLDEAKIKAELTGLNNTQATNYLASIEGVESSNLEYFPSFIRSFPRIKNNIYLMVTVSDSSRK